MRSRLPLGKSALRVFLEGEEQPGIIFYAYWRGEPQVEPVFPLNVWPKGSKVKSYRLFGEGWTVLTWDLAVKELPPQTVWTNLIRKTLELFIETGARVAWCGFEGYFADPPSLFAPKEMSGGVYAALTAELGFLCTLKLEEPLETLADEVLLKLRALL